jgi:tRNA-modifying protein YgfZ
MNLNSYQAAISQSAFLRLPQAGLLKIKGPDQEAFLQRQTTRDIGLLEPGKALVSVLTSPTARILDVFYLIKGGTSQDPEITAITLPGRAGRTAQFLKSRIFFNDNVIVHDAGEDFTQIELPGPFAEILIRELGASDLVEVEGSKQVDLEGCQALVISPGPGFGLGYRLVIDSADAEKVEAALEKKGATRLTEQVYDLLRIEAGLPGPAGELTEEYTPLEVNLGGAVSDNKGCYTGQEIIARQLTYDKVTRQLVGLRLEAPAGPGAALKSEGKPAGLITSATVSPRFGPIALAVIKRTFLDLDASLEVTSESGQARAQVIRQPLA